LIIRGKKGYAKSNEKGPEEGIRRRIRNITPSFVLKRLFHVFDLFDMKKVRILSILCTIILIGCSASVRSSKPHSDPDGFKDIKWGTDIATLKDMEKAGLANPSGKDIALYTRKEETLAIGKAKIESTFYSFWMGSFESVWIDFEGDENLQALRKELLELYGKVSESGELRDNRGVRKEQANQIYTWEGENTEIFIFYSKIRHKGNVHLDSRKIAEERRAYEKQKREEEKLKRNMN